MSTQLLFQKRGVLWFYQVILIILIVILLSGLLTATAFADHAGDALEFDGAGEYVRIGDTGVLMGGVGWQSEKTVSLWLKPDNTAAPVTDPPSGEMIVGVDYPQIFGINRANFNGQDRIWVWNADSNGFDVIGIPYTSGEWMHIALVHSGGVLSAYRNGELVGTRTSGATYAPANGRMYIAGSGRSASTRYFGGQIDEVQFWNLGLDSAAIGGWWDEEVTDLHPNWSNLAAYYKMSDGIGIVLTDDSGNGRTGDMLGGMGDENWVPSDALDHSGPTSTPTAMVDTATPTPLPPTETPTEIVITDTPTLTAVVDTATPTPLPPSETPTEIVITDTPTPTALVDTATPTPDMPTQTPTAIIASPTPTPEEPTSTSAAPTLTPTSVSGVADYALEFDGVGEYVLLRDTDDLMGGVSWTSTKSISFWVKPGMDAAPVTHPASGEMIFWS